MKATKTIDYFVCDVCKKEAYRWDRCYRCGKDLCSDHAITMASQTYFDCSSDPKFCEPCYQELYKEPTDLFKALLQIKRLRLEEAGFCADFKARREEAEKRVKELMG